MASNIDPTKPVQGNPKTANVRANFSAAKDEIEALQAAVPSAIPMPVADGGTGADLSATGGSLQYVKQLSSGAVLTVGTIAAPDYPDVVGDSGSGGTKGAVPAPGTGDAAAGKYLKADATWATPVTNGSIDTAHLAADAVTGAKIADDAVDSEHYVDGSIDTAHLAADAVTGAKIADDAVDSEHLTNGSIDTAHIGDNQVTLAKMAGGTDGNIISYDSNGDPVAVATGNDGQVLTSAGAGSPPAFEDASGGGGFTEGTEVTPTSGQSAAFTSIPSGTKVIFVTWSGVSFGDYSYLKIQLGDSGGLESSGYVGTTISIYGGTITQGVPASGRTTSSTYFIMGGSNGSYGMAASVSLHGMATLTLEDSTNNTWGFTSMMTGDGVDMDWGAGSKSLSGELTQIAVQSGAVGSEASSQFDAGNINILYSG